MEKVVVSEKRVDEMINIRLHSALADLGDRPLRIKQLNSEELYMEDISIRARTGMEEAVKGLGCAKEQAACLASMIARMISQGAIPLDDTEHRRSYKHMRPSIESKIFEKLEDERIINATVCNDSLEAFFVKLDKCISDLNELFSLLTKIEKNISASVARATIQPY